MVEHPRTLGFWVAFALGLGTMIAVGIFSLSGTAAAEVGSSAVISFVLAAFIAGTSAASYSEFASIYTENGGGYLFSSRTFERDWLEYAVGVSLFLGGSSPRRPPGHRDVGNPPAPVLGVRIDAGPNRPSGRGGWGPRARLRQPDDHVRHRRGPAVPGLPVRAEAVVRAAAVVI